MDPITIFALTIIAISFLSILFLCLYRALIAQLTIQAPTELLKYGQNFVTSIKIKPRYIFEIKDIDVHLIYEKKTRASQGDGKFKTYYTKLYEDKKTQKILSQTIKEREKTYSFNFTLPCRQPDKNQGLNLNITDVDRTPSFKFFKQQQHAGTWTNLTNHQWYISYKIKTDKVELSKRMTLNVQREF